jgi:hypothetical protein
MAASRAGAISALSAISHRKTSFVEISQPRAASRSASWLVWRRRFIRALFRPGPLSRRPGSGTSPRASASGSASSGGGV